MTELKLKEHLAKRNIVIPQEKINRIVQITNRLSENNQRFVSTDAMIKTKNLEALKKSDLVTYNKTIQRLSMNRLQDCIACGHIVKKEGKLVATEKYEECGVKQVDECVNKWLNINTKSELI